MVGLQRQGAGDFAQFTNLLLCREAELNVALRHQSQRFSKEYRRDLYQGDRHEQSPFVFPRYVGVCGR